MKTERTINVHHYSFPLIQPCLSTPHERIEEVHNAILAAEKERIASETLLCLIDNMLEETSVDMACCSNIVIEESVRNVDLLSASEIQITNKLKQVIHGSTLRDFFLGYQTNESFVTGFLLGCNENVFFGDAYKYVLQDSVRTFLWNCIPT